MHDGSTMSGCGNSELRMRILSSFPILTPNEWRLVHGTDQDHEGDENEVATSA